MEQPEEYTSPRDIGWENLDIKKFFILNTACIFVMRSVLYPQQLVKTRLQVQEDRVYNGMLDAWRKILRKEGVKGFYKGFATTSVGFIPAQAVYITTLESVRHFFPAIGPNPDGLKALVAGACSSLASVTITIPIEIVSQRLMVQDGSINQYNYTGPFHAVSQILKTEGMRGLYRGWGAALISYAPSNAIWWATYHATRSELLPSFQGSSPMLLNAVCSTCAATAAVLLTNPLDVAKTRLQVMKHEGVARANLFSILMDLFKKEGFRGLTRGVQARLTNMIFVSFLMITIYENVKLWSLKS